MAARHSRSPVCTPIAVGLVSLGTGKPRLIVVAMMVVAVVAVPETRGIDLLPVAPEPSDTMRSNGPGALARV